MNLDAVTSFFTSVSVDLIVIVGFVLVCAIYAARMGVNLPISIAIGLPLTQFASALMIGSVFVGTLSDPTSESALQTGLFIGTAVLLIGLVHRMTSAYGDLNPSFPLAILTGVATMTVVIDVWVETPALSVLWQFGPSIQSIFAESYRLWWFLGAYLALAFVRS
ncbi:hypothetical protein HY970_02570 [Candidatus Kaiserbacteria bacterium]|nr:hypothetical protein [Candidatus Kaiserbacteria bacterium]